MIWQRCQSSASSACRFFMPLLQQNRDSGVGFLECWREPWNKLPSPQPPSKIWGGLAGQKCCKIIDLNILCKKEGEKDLKGSLKKWENYPPNSLITEEQMSIWVRNEKEAPWCALQTAGPLKAWYNSVILWQLLAKFELHRLKVWQRNTGVWQNLQVPRNEVTEDRKFIYSMQNACF